MNLSSIVVLTKPEHLEEICPEVTRRTLQRDLNNLIELNLVRLYY